MRASSNCERCHCRRSGGRLPAPSSLPQHFHHRPQRAPVGPSFVADFAARRDPSRLESPTNQGQGDRTDHSPTRLAHEPDRVGLRLRLRRWEPLGTRSPDQRQPREGGRDRVPRSGGSIRGGPAGTGWSGHQSYGTIVARPALGVQIRAAFCRDDIGTGGDVLSLQPQYSLIQSAVNNSERRLW